MERRQVGDVKEIEANIHAGAKYMRKLMEEYFADAEFDTLNRCLFAFASYNAGPALEGLLASSYTLYLKTHNYHWNVKGPMFTTLHTLFETEYTELALGVDQIAERIRALGHPAPGTYAAFQERSAVKERTGVPKATEMLKELVRDQGIVADGAREALHAAEAVGDDASADLAVQRIRVHEKNAWMLRSHLD